MNNAPFLPGLALALTVWVLPGILRFLPDRLLSPLTQRLPAAPRLAPWIWSFGSAYAGLLLGWISSRDYGLTGQTPAEWALGAAAAIVFGLALAWVSVRFGDLRSWGDVRGEARWCLYRGAVWPLVNFLPLAVIAALFAAFVEFLLGGRKGSTGLSRSTIIAFLVRLIGSGALFFLAHNFFLMMLYYLIARIASRPEFYQWLENTRARITGLRIKIR